MQPGVRLRQLQFEARRAWEADGLGQTAHGLSEPTVTHKAGKEAHATGQE